MCLYALVCCKQWCAVLYAVVGELVVLTVVELAHTAMHTAASAQAPVSATSYTVAVAVLCIAQSNV
jgi:hypothetical protein